MIAAIENKVFHPDEWTVQVGDCGVWEKAVYKDLDEARDQVRWHRKHGRTVRLVDPNGFVVPFDSTGTFEITAAHTDNRVSATARSPRRKGVSVKS